MMDTNLLGKKVLVKFKDEHYFFGILKSVGKFIILIEDNGYEKIINSEEVKYITLYRDKEGREG